MRYDTFYNRSKLNVMTTNFFKEVIKIKRIVRIEIIDYCHSVPFHSMFFQKVDTLHNFHEGRFPHFVFAIFVVKLLRPVNRNTYQPVIVVEKTAPVIGQESSVGLNTVVDCSASCIFSL